jgi:hypothetical protein
VRGDGAPSGATSLSVHASHRRSAAPLGAPSAAFSGAGPRIGGAPTPPGADSCVESRRGRRTGARPGISPGAGHEASGRIVGFKPCGFAFAPMAVRLCLVDGHRAPRLHPSPVFASGVTASCENSSLRSSRLHDASRQRPSVDEVRNNMIIFLLQSSGTRSTASSC